jgi:hypothetical protein
VRWATPEQHKFLPTESDHQSHKKPVGAQL